MMVEEQALDRTESEKMLGKRRSMEESA